MAALAAGDAVADVAVVASLGGVVAIDADSVAVGECEAAVTSGPRGGVLAIARWPHETAASASARAKKRRASWIEGAA